MFAVATAGLGQPMVPHFITAWIAPTSWLPFVVALPNSLEAMFRVLVLDLLQIGRGMPLVIQSQL